MNHPKTIPVTLANWIMNDLKGVLNKRGYTFTDSPLTPTHAAALFERLVDGTISKGDAKAVVNEIIDHYEGIGKEPT